VSQRYSGARARQCRAGGQDRLAVEPLVARFVAVNEQGLVEQEASGGAVAGNAAGRPLEPACMPCHQGKLDQARTISL